MNNLHAHTGLHMLCDNMMHDICNMKAASVFSLILLFAHAAYEYLSLIPVYFILVLAIFAVGTMDDNSRRSLFIVEMHMYLLYMFGIQLPFHCWFTWKIEISLKSINNKIDRSQLIGISFMQHFNMCTVNEIVRILFWKSTCCCCFVVDMEFVHNYSYSEQIARDKSQPVSKHNRYDPKQLKLIRTLLTKSTNSECFVHTNLITNASQSFMKKRVFHVSI